MTDPNTGAGALSCALDPERTDSAQTESTFPVVLNDKWRVTWDSLQWILENRSRKERWEGRRFHQQREWLVRSIRELCGPVEPDAMAALQRLPEWHH